MTIEYRNTSLNDIRDIDSLNRESLPENYEFDDWKIVLKQFSKYSFVAVFDSKIIGYCICIPEDFLISRASIASIAVSSEYRGKGIGKQLMLKSILAIKNVNKNANFTLHCRVTNSVAIKTYTRLGFKQKSIEKDYYKTPVEDAFIMWR